MASTRSSCEVREKRKEKEREREIGETSISIDAPSVQEKKKLNLNLKNPTSSQQNPTGYFSQFGAVTRVRLSRVKKTAKPKSYAFLEFANPAVAAIAADAMDGYLMFSQRLSVKVMAPESVHPTLFRGANRKFTKVPWKQLEAKRVNKKLTPAEADKRRARAAKTDSKRAEKIKKSGIDYQYERLLESILEEKPTVSKKVAGAAGGRKTKAAAAEAVAAEQKPSKKAKTVAAAEATKAPAAARAAAAKKPAAKKAPAAAAAAAKKTMKREPAAVSTGATRSSKRARG